MLVYQRVSIGKLNWQWNIPTKFALILLNCNHSPTWRYLNPLVYNPRKWWFIIHPTIPISIYITTTPSIQIGISPMDVGSGILHIHYGRTAERAENSTVHSSDPSRYCWIWLWPMTDPAGAVYINATTSLGFLLMGSMAHHFLAAPLGSVMDLVMTFTVGHGKSLVVMELSSWVNQRFSMANCWS